MNREPAASISEPAATHHLAIYVMKHCANCDYAREVAAAIRRDYPHVAVKVVDLAEPQGEQIPEAVFATPTYVLNGRAWSLGNPSPQQIRDAFG